MRSANRTTVRALAATAATAIALTIAAPATASAAPATDSGLFGTADPTYDGVFRQSLGLLGLTAVGVKPSVAAVSWLLGQQCSDGSFQAYRADPAVACGTSDAVAYTGPDTNSTALAVAALMSIDDASAVPSATRAKVVSAASRATTWLLRQQAKDGGWTWFPGGTSDANSTGLVMAAILAQAPSPKIPALVAGRRFLGTLVTPCSSADGGGLMFQAGAKADAGSSSQGFVGLTGTVPVAGPKRLAAAPSCAGTTASKVASYLSKQILAQGALQSAYGTGPDYTSTATAVLGFVSAGNGRQAVAKATATLAANAAAYTKGDDGAHASALGLLLMVSEATGRNPKSFGGINLIAALQGSQR